MTNHSNSQNRALELDSGSNSEPSNLLFQLVSSTQCLSFPVKAPAFSFSHHPITSLFVNMAKAAQGKTHRVRAPSTKIAESIDDPPKKARAAEIRWAANPKWTQQMVLYLTEHPAFRIGLFGDSTMVAGQEKRKKVTVKDGKAQQYAVLAKDIFEGDEKMGEEYSLTPARFATSVETRLRR